MPAIPRPGVRVVIIYKTYNYTYTHKCCKQKGDTQKCMGVWHVGRCLGKEGNHQFSTDPLAKL